MESSSPGASGVPYIPMCEDRDKKLAEDKCEGRLRLLLTTIILALQAASVASLSLAFYQLAHGARP